jgi:hypothetical protein
MSAMLDLWKRYGPCTSNRALLVDRAGVDRDGTDMLRLMTARPHRQVPVHLGKMLSTPCSSVRVARKACGGVQMSAGLSGLPFAVRRTSLNTITTASIQFDQTKAGLSRVGCVVLNVVRAERPRHVQ